MKIKIFLIILLFFVFSNTAFSKTINGGVLYTLNELQEIAFENISTQIDMNVYKQYLSDENFQENQKAFIKNKYYFRSRKVTFFSDGSYAIRYKSMKDKSFYYDQNGNLIKIDFHQQYGEMSKRICYDEKGKLDSIALDLSPEEQMIFGPNRNLLAHWIGDNCYDKNGQLIMTRN